MDQSKYFLAPLIIKGSERRETYMLIKLSDFIFSYQFLWGKFHRSNGIE